MDIIALTNDDYVRLGNACNMTVEDLKMLKKDLSITLKNAQKNRGWTINDK